MNRYTTFLFFMFFLPDAGLVLAQNTTHEEHLVWDCTITGYRPNHNYPGHGAYHITLQKLSYLLDSTVLWTREAPESVKTLTGVYVIGKEGEYKTGDTIRKIGNDSQLYLVDFYVCDNIFLQTTIGISCNAGFLLLDKRNGGLLIDHPYPAAEEESDGYFTPETDIAMAAKGSSCHLTSRCRKGEFTGKCSDYLFHYNGHTLFVFDKKNKLINTQRGTVRLTADRKFTTFHHRKYRVAQEARKRNLEK
jgi:hypothetical protein